MSNDARDLIERLDEAKPTITQIRSIAKEQGKNHELATELWKRGGFRPRMLSLLIVDLKAVDLPYVEMLISDIEKAEKEDQSQLCGWMIASVLMMKAALKKETTKWRSAASTIKQRVFWSVQARTIRAENRELNEELLGHIENEIAAAPDTVQWNMNWCAAEIGIADDRLRDRCLALGERLGLYRDYPVSKGCTSPYLPEWIGYFVGKKGEMDKTGK